jgi:hypothetical protein
MKLEDAGRPGTEVARRSRQPRDLSAGAVHGDDGPRSGERLGHIPMVSHHQLERPRSPVADDANAAEFEATPHRAWDTDDDDNADAHTDGDAAVPAPPRSQEDERVVIAGFGPGRSLGSDRYGAGTAGR